MQEDDNQEAGWTFKRESSAPTEYQPVGASHKPSSSVEWSASEYVANPRNASWFLGLIFLSFFASAVIYMISRDVISTIAILFLGLAVGIFSAHKPKVLDYTVDEKGIKIGHKHYAYSTFRSFSILGKAGFGSIYLMPLKRFMPPIEIHFSLVDQESIVSILGDYLPFEERKPDLVDNLFDRLRF